LEILADPERHGLSELFREALQEVAERLRFLDERVGAYDDRIERVFKQDERCKRLAEIEGATAMVAAVGKCARIPERTGTLGVAGAGATSALQRQFDC